MNLLFKSSNKINRFFFILFSITFSINAQNLNYDSKLITSDISSLKPYKTISFGEKINLGKIENAITWTISSVGSNDKAILNGEEINNYKFEIPGNYEISYTDSKLHLENECNHISYPKVMIIKVSPIKMEFDFSTLSISKTIEGGLDMEGSELSLIVNFKSYTNDSISFSNGKIESAGVGTTIKGQLTNTVTLKPGNNKVVYKLKGSASKDTFIMLDFFDINEQVQSYYYPTKL